MNLCGATVSRDAADPAVESMATVRAEIAATTVLTPRGHGR
jgi:hypothetical protein